MTRRSTPWSSPIRRLAGSLDYESTARDLQQVVKTKKTELLFLALFLRLLQPGGRAAVIVPDGVLFGSSKAHRTLRTVLVEEQKLDAIVSMPSGVFKPYAGVSTAILLFTKTNSGGTDHVWFYNMQADGYSLDDKRTPQPDKSDLPDILARWQNRKAERKRARTDQSFLVPKAEIAGNDYDLTINRYKEVEYEEVKYDPPKVILGRLVALEEEIQRGMKELEGMNSGDDHARPDLLFPEWRYTQPGGTSLLPRGCPMDHGRRHFRSAS